MSFYQALSEVNKRSLAERKESAREFFEAMRDDPDLVGERIGWLLGGNYGHDEMVAAQRVVRGSLRSNKEAQLTHMIGVLEWSCPPDMARKSWHKLSAAQKAGLTRAVQGVMHYGE